MEILSHIQHKELLAFLPRIKPSITEWLFINVHIAPNSDGDFTTGDLAKIIQILYQDKEGKLYVGSDREILLLLHWNDRPATATVAQDIKDHLPAGSCDVVVSESTIEGLAKLELDITYRKKAADQSLYSRRLSRKKNIVLVADDDMYQRAIIQKGLSKIADVLEVESGNDLEHAYLQHNPDILFLDIHMPGRSGRDLVFLISELDPDSYIVMISADGSHENVADTWQKGAREFLTKPFTKERLVECALQCPTIVKPST